MSQEFLGTWLCLGKRILTKEEGTAGLSLFVSMSRDGQIDYHQFVRSIISQ